MVWKIDEKCSDPDRKVCLKIENDIPSLYINGVLVLRIEKRGCSEKYCIARPYNIKPSMDHPWIHSTSSGSMATAIEVDTGRAS